MTTPLLFDSHMHTPLCNHAKGEPEEYAAEAVQQGLRGIIFTCHSPMPETFRWQSVRMRMDQLEEYAGMIQRCAEKYAGQLEVRLGIESDWFPGFEDWIAELHQRMPFHYCLGSVHWHGQDYLESFDTGTPDTFRSMYFQHLAESAESGLFDCLAHPDLVKNYHHQSWNFEAMRPIIAESLDRIAKTGVAMELNTSGLQKICSETNPGPSMLAMMHERGIPIVLGSDSHKPQRVAENFFSGLEMLQKAGYEQVSVFEQRQRHDCDISKVLTSLRKAQEEKAEVNLIYYEYGFFNRLLRWLSLHSHMTTSCQSTILGFASLFLASLSSVNAATVSFNSASDPIDSVDVSSFNAKIRVSNTNFDQSLGIGGGTNSSRSFIGTNLGNTSQINARTYDFSIENRVGQGIIFTVSDTQTTPTIRVLRFGSGFDPGITPPTSSPLNYLRITTNSLGGVTYSGLSDFNSLLIQARANEVSSLTPDEQVTIQSISFTSATLTQEGSLDTGTVLSNTPGNGSGVTIGGNPVTPATGIWQQRVSADTNLKDHNWQLSGRLQLRRPAISGSDENISFIVTGQNVTFVPSPIPEPSRALLILLGGLGLVLQRRRP
jgi:histidinol-phosphatase (PHP family)